MTDDVFLNDLHEHFDQLTKAVAITKEPVFDALSAASITSVVVEFDGSGDEGQIEEIVAYAGVGNKVGLPTGTVESVQVPGYGSKDAPTTQTMTVEDAIERLVYDCLEASHGGWEINEGSFGEFAFDVATRTITLDFNGRITEIEHSEAVF